MDIDILRAELERLFELDELVNLSKELLGFDPEQIGGTAGKGSFVRALTQHCVSSDAVEALCDALVASRPQVSGKIQELRVRGLPKEDEIKLGQQLGPYTIIRKFGEGTAAIAYLARSDAGDFRLRLLRHEATRDPRGLHRLLTLTRLVAAVDAPGLPKGVTTGHVDGRWYIAHDHVEAQPLAARIGRTGAMHINEARDVMRDLLTILGALHGARLTHGNLKLENVLVARGADGSQSVLLVDAGGDRLRTRAPQNGRIELLSVSSPRTVAPEQLRGEMPTELSDIYSFGALLYEVLTGKPMFKAGSAIETALAHLSEEPKPPSEVAPRGWVPKELDDFVLSLVAKDPRKRPATAAEVLGKLESIGKPAAAIEQLSDEELTNRIDAVIGDPSSESAALDLESAVESGADPTRVAEAFTMAADVVDDEMDDAAEIKKALYYRVGRLYQDVVKDPEKAEAVYATIAAMDPDDAAAATKLEDLRRRLGKWEEIIETLLGQAEAAESRGERARLMAKLGKITETELEDTEQALVAYTQALCEDPATEAYADEVERLAGQSGDAWGEVLSACNEASTEDRHAEEKTPLFVRMGRWYLENYARPDLALQCYQAILVTEPSHDGALNGLTTLYRRAQSWRELGGTLMRHADATTDPAKARDLRCEAAKVLQTQLGDPKSARDIYVHVLEDDPGHEKAADALGQLFAQTGDFQEYVKLLERQAEALNGEDKHRAICRIAEIHEINLHDDNEAGSRYFSVIEEDSENIEALRGLDRIFSKLGKYKELLENLDAQVQVAATPRQKIGLLERMAGIYEEEFLDHEKTAQILEAILDLDPAHQASMGPLARHYRALSRWYDLEQLLERHAELVTDDAQTLDLLLARAHVLSDQINATDRAIEAYEAALRIAPAHAGALEALAQLRESAGDEDAALTAIVALAERAETGEARAEQLVRAAKLLMSRGDRDAAIERYKQALDANPKDTAVSLALREAYVERGDANAAIELCEREIERTEGDAKKAKLAAEMAAIQLDQLEDEKKAEAAAKRAIDFDPTNARALGVLGDLYFQSNRLVEAASNYEKLVDKTDTMPAAEAVRVLMRYVDALAKTGSTEKALAPMDTLLRLAPEDKDALTRVADVTFEHGSPKRARELYTTLLEKHGEEMSTDEKSQASYRVGEAARLSGDLDEAIHLLNEASDVDPSNALPLAALALAHESKEAWKEVVDAKTRHLDIAEGEVRVRLLLEVAELATAKLEDRSLATKSLVAALDERPDDRKLLMRLMQLYSEEKDWSKLIEVVVKLADFVREPAQQAKYLQTAAMVAAQEMGDPEQALSFHERVRALDPKNEKSQDEIIELLQQMGDFDAAVEQLKDKAKAASEAKNNPRMLEAFNLLGEIYKDKLGRIGHSIDAYEAAQTLDPENAERNELLAELYASNPTLYLDKAVSAQLAMLANNPYREQSYKLLRRLYTEAKRADPAWCMCQALYVLQLAEPDEERFFRRMRSEDPAYAQEVLSEEDWVATLLHADAEPLLTSVFALIEPAIIATRSQSFEALGYDQRYAVDPAQHPYPLSQTLYYAAGVMGVECPPTFENVNDPGGLSFLHAFTPSVVLGNAALTADIPPQAAAFIAARHLAYYRPGMYIRHLVPSGSGLKNWLFAAIRMNSPKFPVAADIEGPVKDAQAALEKHLSPQVRDHLSRIVSKLLQSGRSLDLRKWVAGVDATADRVGFLLSHDLETSVEIVRASDEASSSMQQQQRLKELVLFAISEPYFGLREKLKITIDS